MRQLHTIATALLFLLIAPFAHANLVKNGNFEAMPDHTLGWTYESPDGLSLFGPDFSIPNSTNNVFHDGSSSDLGTLSQSLVTKIGAKYTLQFDLLLTHDESYGEKNTRFILEFDGVVLVDATNTLHGWQTFTFSDLLATTASTLLLFSNMNETSYNELDNISVVRQDPGGVPEPATWLLLATGAVAFFVVRRRTRA